MSDHTIPIGKFRSKTAEVLRTIQETQASYVITSHGQPVAEIVPYGTPVRKKGKPLLGLFEVANYVHPWQEEGLTEQAYEDRERARRVAFQERRADKVHGSVLGRAEPQAPLPE